jgi:hypothetical protein
MVNGLQMWRQMKKFAEVRDISAIKYAFTPVKNLFLLQNS